MDKEQILREILHHTEMMESALDAEDFEVFEYSLDARGTLIEAYKRQGFLSDAHDEEVLKRVSEIHERAVAKLVSLKEKTGRELDSIREERRSISRARQVQNQYQGYMETSGSLDTKK